MENRFANQETQAELTIPWRTLDLDFYQVQQSQVLVAHAYNPSYSGDRDQEDIGSKPALANSS
jgi:hypothetical protein